jgi:hemerythrin-like metal-binding protein
MTCINTKLTRPAYAYAETTGIWAMQMNDTPPTALQWNEALALDMPMMDHTHREFVELLQAVVFATDVDILQRWSALIAHTQEHFDTEDHWMLATGFAPGNCHATQHKVILQVMREGEVHGHQGDLAMVRQMAHELGLWFPQHAQSMDASLALHLRSAGYDPMTGTLTAPVALPGGPIHGCGGACGDEST